MNLFILSSTSTIIYHIPFIIIIIIIFITTFFSSQIVTQNLFSEPFFGRRVSPIELSPIKHVKTIFVHNESLEISFVSNKLTPGLQRPRPNTSAAAAAVELRISTDVSTAALSLPSHDDPPLDQQEGQTGDHQGARGRSRHHLRYLVIAP